MYLVYLFWLTMVSLVEIMLNNSFGVDFFLRIAGQSLEGSSVVALEIR